MKYALKIANAYQITIWLISTIYYFFGMINSILPNKDSISLVGSFIVLFFSIIIVWSNIYLLLNKNNIRLILKSLQFNKWINLIQILNFSLIGINIYMIIGIRLMALYLYDNTQKLAIDYGFFRFQSEISYVKSDIIFVGINIIPIILYIIFNKSIQGYKEIMTPVI
jgi:hypothetical protein